MNVVVLNTVLSNTGDAAIYQAIVSALQAEGIARPDEVRALDSSARDTAALYPSWNVLQQPTRSAAKNRWIRRGSNACRRILVEILRRSRFLRAAIKKAPLSRMSFSQAIAAIDSADLVLSSGGTYLVDHYNFRHRVQELELAREMGKPIYLWTQSAGPFKDSRARGLIQRLTPKLDGVFFRDERSRSAWSSVAKLPAAEGVAPDCVFGLYEGTQQVGGASAPNSPTALLSVRDWAQGAEGGSLDFALYRSAMRRVAANLLSNGWTCVAVSTCQGVAGYNVDDAQTAHEVFDGLDVTINADFHTPDQLVELIRSSQLVVSTRMHLAILSLISQTPVIAIAYEPKSLELFRSLGHSGAVIEIEKTSEGWADSLFVDGDARSCAARLSTAELEQLSDQARVPARLIASRLVSHVG